MAESTVPFRRFFPLEAAASLSMILFGLVNIFGASSGLHSVIAVYLFAGGILFAAIAIRRRLGAPQVLPDNTNGLVKAIAKLSETKPYGFTCLAAAPLALGYGGLGIVVFLLLYFSSVNAMRLTDEELMTWVGPPKPAPSPRAPATAKTE